MTIAFVDFITHREDIEIQQNGPTPMWLRVQLIHNGNLQTLFDLQSPSKLLWLPEAWCLIIENDRAPEYPIVRSLEMYPKIFKKKKKFSSLETFTYLDNRGETVEIEVGDLFRLE